MYQITKQEAFMMRENGYEKFVLKSHSKHPKYYLVEDYENVYKYYNETDDDGNPVYDKYGKKKKYKELIRLSAMNALEKYRKSHIVKEVTDESSYIHNM